MMRAQRTSQRISSGAAESALASIVQQTCGAQLLGLDPFGESSFCSHVAIARCAIMSFLGYIGEIFHKGNSFPGEHKAISDRELWGSVRAELAENHRARRHRTDTSEPSLLSGLIFDENGSRYTPSHAVKKESGIDTTFYRDSSMADPRLQRRVGFCDLLGLVHWR
jgi:hypothetical protein